MDQMCPSAEIFFRCEICEFYEMFVPSKVVFYSQFQFLMECKMWNIEKVGPNEQRMAPTTPTVYADIDLYQIPGPSSLQYQNLRSIHTQHRFPLQSNRANRRNLVVGLGIYIFTTCNKISYGNFL
ncbi:hypothetical protein OCU04_001298 [Sclerotinia nivalis]|uniref:Uncharacterized protein n=1 Tax=Sclerotinia nivalis TaxID=352851 RepID=A0A9X0AXS9_9HELO|nr:hypothetical protein OCU04_001298 [Sclerotinia nivalis]